MKETESTRQAMILRDEIEFDLLKGAAPVVNDVKESTGRELPQ